MHKSPTCLPHGQAFHIESHSFWFSSGNLSQLPLDLVPCNRGCKASLADLKRYAATMQEHCYESSLTTLKCNNLDVFSNNIFIIADRFNEKNLSQWTIHETCNAWDTEQTFHIMQQHKKKKSSFTLMQLGIQWSIISCLLSRVLFVASNTFNYRKHWLNTVNNTMSHTAACPPLFKKCITSFIAISAHNLGENNELHKVIIWHNINNANNMWELATVLHLFMKRHDR